MERFHARFPSLDGEGDEAGQSVCSQCPFLMSRPYNGEREPDNSTPIYRRNLAMAAVLPGESLPGCHRYLLVADTYEARGSGSDAVVRSYTVVTLSAC